MTLKMMNGSIFDNINICKGIIYQLGENKKKLYIWLYRYYRYLSFIYVCVYILAVESNMVA